MSVVLPSLAEGERLGIIEGEVGEALAYMGKIRRHGFTSRHPDQSHPDSQRDNREALETELAHVVVGIALMIESHDLNRERFEAAMKAKAAELGRWIHHQEPLLSRLQRGSFDWLDIWQG